MSKTFAAVVLTAALAAYVGFSGAESFAVGGMKLSGGTIELGQQTVVAAGHAKFVSPEASIEAESIRFELAKGKDGKLTFAKGTATGGVVIRAKQTDKTAKTARDIHATGKSAAMVRGEDTVVITGNVVLKVTDPDLAEPATITGEKVTVFLKENRILAQRSADKPAELTVAPKEDGK